MKTSRLILLILTLFITSCGGMINKMHKDFDRHDKRSAPRTRYDKFDMYRKRGARRAPYKKGKRVSTRNKRFVAPSVKRKYFAKNMRKRFKAEDLEDNKNESSLWSGESGNDNFLFTKDNKKKNGDIVLVQIQGRLKNEITAELNRAYPKPKKKKKKKQDKAEPTAPKTAAAPAPAKPKAKDEKKVSEGDNKVYDRLSSVVVEEINREHILIRGRKNLLFRKRKRTVEVQALLSRKDVMDDDTIFSDKIIETNVSVMR